MARLNCVTVLAPAKLNLALDVVGLLPSGYHDLDMTMQAITLYERVVLRRSPYLNLRLPGSLVAPNNKNTAIKAALAFFDYTGLLAGVDITIYKNTPVRAGMAGGSADAAGTLVALNRLHGSPLTTDALCAIGEKVGADVPFCLRGGTMLATGIGTTLSPLPPLPDCFFVIAKPAFGISTAAAYAAVDNAPFLPATDTMQKALQTGDLAAVGAAMENRFAQVLCLADVDRLCDALRKAGALGACMTGSGSAVIGLFETKTAALAALSTVRALCAFSVVAAPFDGGPKIIEEL